MIGKRERENKGGRGRKKESLPPAAAAAAAARRRCSTTLLLPLPCLFSSSSCCARGLFYFIFFRFFIFFVDPGTFCTSVFYFVRIHKKNEARKNREEGRERETKNEVFFFSCLLFPPHRPSLDHLLLCAHPRQQRLRDPRGRLVRRVRREHLEQPRTGASSIRAFAASPSPGCSSRGSSSSSFLRLLPLLLPPPPPVPPGPPAAAAAAPASAA